jgi:hypothetical protein
MSNWNKFKSEFVEASIRFGGPKMFLWKDTKNIYGSLQGEFWSKMLNKDVVFTVSTVELQGLPTLYDVRWTCMSLRTEIPEKIYFKTIVSTPLQAATAILHESRVINENSPANK